MAATNKINDQELSPITQQIAVSDVTQNLTSHESVLGQNEDEGSIYSFVCSVLVMNFVTILVCIASSLSVLYSDVTLSNRFFYSITLAAAIGIILTVASLIWAFSMYARRVSLITTFYLQQLVMELHFYTNL